MKVRLFDKEFAHVGTVCGLDRSLNLEWIREGGFLNVNVYTDQTIGEIKDCSSGLKVLWLIEPEAIHPFGYQWIRDGHHDMVDYVITYDRKIMELIPDKAIWWQNGSWVWADQWTLSPKTKNISMCASTKIVTERQRFRQEAAKMVKRKIDLLCGVGRDIAPSNRADIFKNFRYSIVIENSCEDYYFSEKLIDCFAFGTIPIYCGCPSIGNYFNMDGIICFSTLQELENEINKTNHDDYARSYAAVVDNFERAKKYVPVEEQLYQSFFRRFD